MVGDLQLARRPKLNRIRRKSDIEKLRGPDLTYNVTVAEHLRLNCTVIEASLSSVIRQNILTVSLSGGYGWYALLRVRQLGASLCASRIAPLIFAKPFVS